jgi:hypothetical protein
LLSAGAGQASSFSSSSSSFVLRAFDTLVFVEVYLLHSCKSLVDVQSLCHSFERSKYAFTTCFSSSILPTIPVVKFTASPHHLPESGTTAT